MQTLLQKANGTGTASFAVPTTPGNTIIVMVAANNAATILATPTDDQGNTYHLVPSGIQTSPSGGTNKCGIWYNPGAADTPTSGVTVVTANFTGTSSNLYVWIYEVQTCQAVGTSPLDVNSGSTGTGTTAVVGNLLVGSGANAIGLTNRCGDFAAVIGATDNSPGSPTFGGSTSEEMWTLDTSQGHNFAMFGFFARGDNPRPFCNQFGFNHWAMSQAFFVGPTITTSATNFGVPAYVAGGLDGNFAITPSSAPAFVPQCAAMHVIAVITTGAIGVTPDGVSSVTNDKGDVYVQVPSTPSLLTGVTDDPIYSVKISVWYCLRASIGISLITVSTTATNAFVYEYQAKSSLGGFALDQFNSITGSGYPFVGAPITATGNDFFVNIMAPLSNNYGTAIAPNMLTNPNPTFTPWCGNSVGPFGVVTGGQFSIGPAASLPGNSYTNSFGTPDDYLSMAVSFKEVVVIFPELSPQPAQLNFTAPDGGPNPASQNVIVHNNAAMGSLPLDYDLEVSSSSIVSATPGGIGTAPQTVAIALDLSGGNYLKNGDFELGTVVHWNDSQPLGGLAINTVTSPVNGGTYSVFLGDLVDSQPDGTWEIYQLVDVVPDHKLDFWYLPKSDFNSNDAHQQCLIYDSTGTTRLDTILDTWDDESSWTHVTYNLGGSFPNQTVRIVFRVTNDTTGPFPGYVGMYLDDINIPFGYVDITSDCWTKNTPANIPIYLELTPLSSMDGTGVVGGLTLTIVEHDPIVMGTSGCDPGPHISIDTSPVPNGTIGVPYPTFAFTIDFGGTPDFLWTVDGQLPPGLTLSPDGVLSGTPITAGTYTFTVKVTDMI